MKTGKLVKYVIDNDLVLMILLEDGTELEVRIAENSALVLGDDIMHGLYTREDEEKNRISKITRTFDSGSGELLESDDDILYVSEESAE